MGGTAGSMAADATASLALAVRASLRTVADPCCRDRGLSVVDMGLLADVDVDEDGSARIDLVLTSGWCPFQVDLLSEVTAAAEAVPGVVDADVRITLDEVWSRERLSARARDRLRLLPEPGEVADRDALVARVAGARSVTDTPTPTAEEDGP